MPKGRPPSDICIPSEHQFFRSALEAQSYSSDDFLTYSEMIPNKEWGEMLPEAGFYYDAADAIKDSNTDSLLIDIPVSDRGFFADIAKRMGWSTKLINSATRKIAVF